MKTLTLSLKKQWFGKIKSGEKKEEYRECSDYWINRFRKLCGKFAMIYAGSHPHCICERRVMVSCADLQCDRLVLRNGYRPDSPTITLKNPKIRIGQGRPEWGAERGKNYFVITWEGISAAPSPSPSPSSRTKKKMKKKKNNRPTGQRKIK